MSTKKRVSCSNCVHFRAAPYEARLSGCYFEKNMPGRQKDAFLDEQQIPGNHEKINLRGDCPDHKPRPARESIWKRLLAS